ncbi:MAG: hypothetical protein P4M11_03350 [Candidatus Pacebacteria bacterium]|nr:hypothetical protein [Candidatus Paceibacterota bacterium]
METLAKSLEKAAPKLIKITCESGKKPRAQELQNQRTPILQFFADVPRVHMTAPMAGDQDEGSLRGMVRYFVENAEDIQKETKCKQLCVIVPQQTHKILHEAQEAPAAKAKYELYFTADERRYFTQTFAQANVEEVLVVNGVIKATKPIPGRREFNSVFSKLFAASVFCTFLMWTQFYLCKQAVKFR